MRKSCLLQLVLAGRTVEPALADRDGTGIARGLGERFGGERALVGSSSGTICGWIPSAIRTGPTASARTASQVRGPDRGDEDALDPGGGGAREDLLAVGIERGEVEVTVTVDHGLV